MSFEFSRVRRTSFVEVVHFGRKKFLSALSLEDQVFTPGHFQQVVQAGSRLG
jgi:hypothetical protein